jgi:mono/diheme cytochrome c family protein
VSFRLSLILLNVLVIGALLGVIGWRVLSMRRNPERTPANLTPFLPDDALEGRRLERVLGWSLVFSVVMIIALLAYFLWEPFRAEDANAQFLDRSVERGAVLFANNQSTHYDSELSLLCANCHGVDGTGGVALKTLQPEADECQKKKNQSNPDVPACAPLQVQWSAPDLTLAPLRYNRAQLIEIITYGRPGTPMQAWGVKSGNGPKNVQSINDLVNYLESIKTTPEQAMKEAEKAVATYRECQQTSGECVPGKDTVTTQQAALAAAQAALAAAQADPTISAADLSTLESNVATGQAQLDRALAYKAEVDSLSDGAILFRLNCARCHTKGWSYFQNEPYRTDLPPLPPQGSGAYGPNLTGGSVLLQFPGKVGLANHTAWVTDGVPAEGQYGIRGISSGRMPHFGNVLTKAQIREVVEYERSL